MRMVRGAHSPQTVNSVHEREGGCNTARYSCPPQPYPGHAGGHKLTTRGRADPPANRHGCVTPSPSRHVGRSVPTPQHKPNHPSHPSHHNRTVTQTRHPNDPQCTTREGAQQTDRNEHEHSTTELEQHPGAPMGSTGTHRERPAGPCHRQGGVHMSGTSKTGSTATEHHEIPDNGLCLQHCQGGAGNRAPTGENIFTAVQLLVMAFLPRGGRAAPSTNVPCRPHTPGTDQHRNKRNTCTQQIRLPEHPLRRQGTNAEQTNQEATNTTTHRQNHYSGRNVTVNRPRAHRPAPSWLGVHGLVRERRPTS